MSELSGMIEKIYDSAITPDRWKTLLLDICNKFGFSHAWLHINYPEYNKVTATRCVWKDNDNRCRTLNNIPDLATLWDQIPNFGHWHPDRPLIASQDMPPGAFEKTPVYRILRPYGLIDIVEVAPSLVQQRRGYISFARHESQGWISDCEFSMLALLSSHIRRALAFADLLIEQRERARKLGCIFRQVPVATIVLNKAGRVCEINEAALKLAEDESLISLAQKTLRFADLMAQAQFEAALSHLHASEGVSEPTAKVIKLSTRNTDGFAHIVPLACDRHDHTASDGLTAIYIQMIAGFEGTASENISKMFGLTNAEMHVLSLLMNGFSTAEITEKLGIARSTVKTHLHRLYSKTGTSRQAELVSFINHLMLNSDTLPVD